MKSTITLLTLGALLATGSAFAQVEARKDNQQKRIAQGVANGQLTPRETKRIERQEQNLNRQIAAERAANGGKLTPEQKAQVNQEQKALSKEIYAEKHDARKTNFKGEVGARQKAQQERIAQGIASGQLTPGEAKRLEGREQRINTEVKTDRAANGGTLTPAEKARINQRQDKASQAIYREKHDTATRK